MTNPIDEREAFDAAFRAAFEFSEHIDQLEFRKGWEAGIIFAIAASPAATAQSGKPVAWQVKADGCNWETCLDETAKRYEGREGVEIHALYATPQPPQPDRALIAEYAQYYHGAKSLKLTPFTFDEYVSKCDAGEL